MSIVTDLNYSFCFDKGVTMTSIMPAFLCSDEEAHRFIIDCHHLNSSEPINLAKAGVNAYFVRDDDVTILLNGETVGNKVSVLLPAACYAVTGCFSLVIKLTLGNSTSTIFWGQGAVSRSRTDVIIDPDSVIPSLDELLARIDAMEMATAAANEAASSVEGIKAEFNDQVGQLSEEIDEINSTIYDRTITPLVIDMTNGAYVGADGEASSNSNSSYTNYIAVTGGATVTLTGVSLNSLRSIVAYATPRDNSGQKERLDDGSTFLGTITVKIPQWANYLRATGPKDGVITGSETVTVDKIESIAGQIESIIDDMPEVAANVINQSPFRAVLPYPMEMPAIPNIEIFATALGYSTSENASKYRIATSGSMYVDAINGDDENKGTSSAPLKTIQAALAKDANTIFVRAGEYPSFNCSKSINIIGVPGVTIKGGSFTGDIAIYLENLDFDGTGLNHACNVIVSASTEKPVFCAAKCSFFNATTNGLTIKGEVTARIFDCVAYNNRKDGFNYHKNTAISPSSGAPNVLEVSCESYGNGGTDTNPTSDNGSTAHNYTQIIRLNGYYHNNHGGNVADNGHTKSWCIGCRAGYSEPTTGNVNNGDYWVNASGVMYLDNCTAEGSTYDIWAESDSAVYVSGGSMKTKHTDSSTVENFERRINVQYTTN